MFATTVTARSALKATGSFRIPCFNAEILSSQNIAEFDRDYIPNILTRTSEEATLDACQALTS
ncbi:hypothetical protein E2C01_041001 [Portunus trituberculatus]|uniref:Uncharacterized protein n=1 Tax=Portunus trituberculatus TaxID=210409 RepID=A0A5B7FI21_PORTR|nr:hypothetical protein [Portunus trituberculatus]